MFIGGGTAQLSIHIDSVVGPPPMDNAARSMTRDIVGMRTTQNGMVKLSRLPRLTGLRICRTESLLCTTQSEDFKTVKSQQQVSKACSA